jgi:hypothetical protein
VIETAGDIKVRFYEIVGRSDIQVDWPGVIGLLNDGAVLMRGLASDRWNTEYQPVTAGVSLYTVPERSIRLIRIAYGDKTLQEVGRAELDAADQSWQTRTGWPDFYTQDGFPFDQYWLYKTPESTSTEFSIINGAYGIVTRVYDGTSYIVFGGAGNFGEIQTLSGFDFQSPYGVLTEFAGESTDRLWLWFVEKVETIIDDSSPIPLPRPDRIGLLWYALWKTYAAEAEMHNPLLEAWYRDLFYAVVARCQKRASNPLPRKRDALRPYDPTERGNRARLPYADRMTPPGGPPVDLLW